MAEANQNKNESTILYPVAPPPSRSPQLNSTKGLLCDDSSYYSSYSDSYNSEGAVPIEPPIRPPIIDMNRNPRTYKFHPNKNPFPLPKNKKSPFSDQQLKKLIEASLHKKDINLTTQEEFESLLYELSKKRVDLAANSKYEDASQYNKAIEHVRSVELKILKSGIQKKAQTEFSAQENSCISAVENFDKETEELLKNLKKEIEDQRESMENRHKIETENFESRWKSQSKNRLYNRPSNVLLELRRQLNFMLTQCRFDEAKEVKKHIKERKKIETSDNYELMMHDFSEAMKKLTDKQEEEKKYFEEKSAIRIRTFEQRRNSLRLGFENRKKKLEARNEIVSDPDKIWQMTQQQKFRERNTAKKAPLRTTMKIAKKDVCQKEVKPLNLPPLSLPLKKKSAKSKKPMKAAKTKQKQQL